MNHEQFTHYPDTAHLQGQHLAALLGVTPSALSSAATEGHICRGYDVSAWAVRSISGRLMYYRVPQNVLATLAPDLNPRSTHSLTTTDPTMPDETNDPAARPEKGAARSTTIWGAALILATWIAAQAGFDLDLAFANGFMDDGALSALEIVQLVGVVLVVVGRQRAKSLLRWLPGKLFQKKDASS